MQTRQASMTRFTAAIASTLLLTSSCGTNRRLAARCLVTTDRARLALGIPSIFG